MVLLLTLASGSNVALAENSCTFKQFSPWLQKWFKACEMPATIETCREKRLSPYQGETKFATTSCDTKGAGAGCQIGGKVVYFYQTTAVVIEKGCSAMGGVVVKNLD
jgi:hypothetical protein